METDRFLPSVTQLIPEGFVDIIRRLTPGATVWIVLYFLTGFPRMSIQGISTGGFVLFLLVSYETGLVLDALTDFVGNGFFKWRAWKDFDAEGVDATVMRRVLRLGDVTPRGNWTEWQAWRDWRVPGLLRAEVVRRIPQAAIVLPKLVAEECLLKNLAVGLFAVLVVLLFVQHRLPPPRISQPLWDYPKSVFGSLGACVFAAMVAALYRVQRTAIRTWEWFRLATLYEYDEVANGRPDD